MRSNLQAANLWIYLSSNSYPKRNWSNPGLLLAYLRLSMWCWKGSSRIHMLKSVNPFLWTVYTCTENYMNWFRNITYLGVYGVFNLYHYLLQRSILKYISLLGFKAAVISSERFSLFNQWHQKVYQDMFRPLCCYWIASSHNTYTFLFFKYQIPLFYSLKLKLEKQFQFLKISHEKIVAYAT